jgi:hypothetical protein
MNIEIRLATENDLQAILNLYAQPSMDNGKVLVSICFGADNVILILDAGDL